MVRSAQGAQPGSGETTGHVWAEWVTRQQGSDKGSGFDRVRGQFTGMRRRNPPRWSGWTLRVTPADVAACRIVSKAGMLGLP